MWDRLETGTGEPVKLEVMGVLVDGRVHQLVVVLKVLVVQHQLPGFRLVQAVHSHNRYDLTRGSGDCLRKRIRLYSRKEHGEPIP